MSIWTFTDTTPPSLECSLTPTCYYCGGQMVVESGNLFKVQMTGQDDPEPKGRAIDIILRCAECGYYECFGVALSQAEAGRIENGQMGKD